MKSLPSRVDEVADRAFDKEDRDNKTQKASQKKRQREPEQVLEDEDDESSYDSSSVSSDVGRPGRLLPLGDERQQPLPVGSQAGQPVFQRPPQQDFAPPAPPPQPVVAGPMIFDEVAAVPEQPREHNVPNTVAEDARVAPPRQGVPTPVAVPVPVPVAKAEGQSHDDTLRVRIELAPADDQAEAHRKLATTLGSLEDAFRIEDDQESEETQDDSAMGEGAPHAHEEEESRPFADALGVALQSHSDQAAASAASVTGVEQSLTGQEQVAGTERKVNLKGENTLLGLNKQYGKQIKDWQKMFTEMRDALVNYQETNPLPDFSKEINILNEIITCVSVLGEEISGIMAQTPPDTNKIANLIGSESFKKFADACIAYTVNYSDFDSKLREKNISKGNMDVYRLIINSSKIDLINLGITPLQTLPRHRIMFEDMQKTIPEYKKMLEKKIDLSDEFIALDDALTTIKSLTTKQNESVGAAESFKNLVGLIQQCTRMKTMAIENDELVVKLKGPIPKPMEIGVATKFLTVLLEAKNAGLKTHEQVAWLRALPEFKRLKEKLPDGSAVVLMDKELHDYDVGGLTQTLGALGGLGDDDTEQG